MPQAVDTLASVLEQLSEQLQALERRVAALEASKQSVILSGAGASQSEATAESKDPYLESAGMQRPRTPAIWRGFPALESSSGVITVIGKAVLGIAGAYLLRALAESPSIPKLPVLFLAILYACAWIVSAARTHAASRFASSTFAVTSALILSPMLWETTVRFQVLSPALASVVLVAFVVLAMVLAWRHDLQLIPWIATLASVITALALIIETRELVPLTAALLTVALATEIAACLGHRLSLRAFPALAADFSVWLLIYILAADSLPEEYRAAAPATMTALSLALLAIYGGSIGVRTFVMRQRLTIFEIVQAIVAFVLATFGALRATHNFAAPELGISFLVFAAACYWGTLVRFTEDSQARNRRVCAWWAAGLLLVGSFLLLPADFQLPFLCAAGILAGFLYTRTAKLSLGLHASFYLAAAAAASPLPAYAGRALGGTVPSSPDWRLGLVAASALICYVVGARHAEAHRTRRILWIVPALLVAFTAAALAIVTVTTLSAGRVELDASRLSVVRTIVNCALALTFAFLGSRLRRIELGWVAYAALAFGTLKLLFEDLRFGNAASLVVSLLFYGLVLILLPRLIRRQNLSS